MRAAPGPSPPLKTAVKGRYQQARGRMVAEQLAARGIKDPLVLDAMRAVPREEFEWVAFVPLVGAHGGRPTPPPVPEDSLNHRKEG